MIELRAITFTHDNARTETRGGPVLDDVTMTLDEGELVLLTGPTGSGKSTLLGVVAGLVPRFTGGTLSGDVVLDGTSILRLPPRDRAEHIGYVGQDPLAGFVTDTVEEELAYGMEQLGLAPATMRRRVEETLDLLGIADLRHRALTTLSGGQQQRVAIGSVLTMHPRFLVLDEPTSALDPTAAEDVLATLTRLVQDLGTGVLVAEHRLERVVPFADRMVLMPGDGSVRVGTPTQILATSPIAPPLVELGRVAGWEPLPLTVRDARSAARRTGLLDLIPPADEPTPSAAWALAAEGIRVSHGRAEVVHGVNLRLAAGTTTALMGRNGAGKSTLLWALQGSGHRSAGTVVTSGGDTAELSVEQRREVVGMLPQSASDLLYLDSVEAECAAGGAGTRAVLDRLVPGIPGDRHPRDLSEGQRLALALSLVLVADPAVVLLDEPTRGLDYNAKHHLAQILADLNDQGRAVLVATHDVEFTAMVASRVVVMAEGEIVSDGPVDEVIAESPAFAPQVTKVLGPGWLRVSDVVKAMNR